MIIEVLCLMLAVIGFLFLFGLLHVIITFVNKSYCNRNMEYLNHNEHAAIILVKKSFYDGLLLYTNYIMFLLLYLKRIERPYRIYKWVNKKEFVKIVKNRNIKWLYIFSHGVRHGIRFGKNEYLYYCELKDAPKKEFIGQFHCNQNGGKSLIDYLSINNEGYITKGLSFSVMNSWHLFRWWLNSKKIKI